MKRNKPEAEVIARLDCETKTAHICVAEWPRYATKFTKIYGEPVAQYDRGGGVVSAWWTVPLKCVSFRKPPSGSGSGRKRGNPNIGKARRRK